MEETQIDSLVVVEQLPIIKQKLQIISDEVDKEIKFALSLECDEDSKTEVKKARARLNKIANTLEEKRKQVKNSIMNPYNEFESIYNELVKDKLKNADAELKNKIDEFEILQKDEIELELKDFANEHFIANNIQDLVTFEDIGLNITLSDRIKSLKDKIIVFCESVHKDLQLIELEEYKDEIMVEYKSCLDYGKSKLTVIARHKQIEEMQQKLENIKEQEEQEQKVVKKVNEVVTPIEIQEDIEFTCKFRTSKENISKLIKFIDENNIEYMILEEGK